MSSRAEKNGKRAKGAQATSFQENPSFKF